MKNDFQEADIAIINQETILGGRLVKGTSDLERRHSLNYYDSTFSIKNLQQLADQIIGDWIID